jgi:hypothetical protein
MESLLNFTAICAVCVLFLYFGSYFRGPLTSEEAAEVKAHMIEMVCSGATQGTPPYSEELCKNRPKR